MNTILNHDSEPKKPGVLGMKNEKINDVDLKLILGGGVPTIDQINALVNGLFSSTFRLEPTLQTNTALLNEFKTEVANLAGTSVGYDMLTQILSSGGKFTINGNSTGLGKGAAKYEESPSRPQLYIGDLFSTPSSSGETILNFGTIAHELYHAYQQLVQKAPFTYSNSISVELDAGIFQLMADEEMDLKKNIIDTGTSYVFNDNNWNNIVTANPTPAVAAFQTAWYDMFKNHNFTTANYNILVQNFTNGAATADQYSNNQGNPLTPTTISDVSQLNVFNFYSKDFEKDVTPLFKLNKIPRNGTASGNPINDDTGHQTIHYNADGTADTGSSGTGTGIGGGGGASSGGPSTGSNSLGGAGFGYGIGVTGSAGSDGSSGSASGGSNASSSDDTGAGTTNNTGTTSPPAGTKPPLKGFR